MVSSLIFNLIRCGCLIIVCEDGMPIETHAVVTSTIKRRNVFIKISLLNYLYLTYKIMLHKKFINNWYDNMIGYKNIFGSVDFMQIY